MIVPLSILPTQSLFADDPTVVGLISWIDVADSSSEIEGLGAWSLGNNLVLNALKTKYLVVDFWRNVAASVPLFIDGVCP